MSKFVKYLLIAVASLGILVIIGILALPALVDVERYKPRIEQLVTEKTGYPLTLGGKISLSLFPWVGLSFTDLQLDNPKGFVNKTFVRIDGFQARVKVLPLLSKKVEISSFVINRPEIFLEKSKKGNWNWEKLTEAGKPTAAGAAAPAAAPKSPTPAGGESNQATAGESGDQGGFALQSLNVGEFAINDGKVQINDLENNLKREISAFTLQLVDLSLNKPIQLTMRAMLDGKPIGLKGSVGPLGPDPLASKINLDLAIEAFDTLHMKASGYVADINKQKTFHLAVSADPFSARQLISRLGLSFPVTTADPKVLDKVGLRATITGDASQVVLSDSKIQLDDSTINVDATAKDFSRPDLAFNVAVDAIDLDRYLPPPAKENKPAAQATTVPASSGTSSSNDTRAEQRHAVDYGPLRKLVLKGTVKLGRMKIHGGSVSNVALDIVGRGGVFTINSLGMDLYEGSLAGTGKLNVQKDTPLTALNLTLQNVQVGPLLKDFAKKDIIEGKFKAEVALTMQGDNGDLIKRSLNGKGDLLFQDGALIGLDLAQMVRNIKSGFTLEQQGERPKTDFAALHAPFSITNGLVNTPETTLQSPFIRVSVTGNANLVSEALDMKIKPTVVGTMKGQGDEEKRAGLTIPVLVSGTFSAPQFRPDLESMVKDRIPSGQELGEMIKTGKVPAQPKEQLKKEVEQAKGLLKGLFGK